MITGRRIHKAFTLVEVMVALAIISLSLTAVAAKMSRMIDTSNSMRETHVRQLDRAEQNCRVAAGECHSGSHCDQRRN